GWTLFVSAVFFAVQIAVMVAWVLAGARGPQGLELEPARTALVSGDLFAVATLATAAVCIPLVWALAAFKARGEAARALALRVPPEGRTLTAWLGATVVLVVASDLLTVALGRPIVPEFMTDLVRATAAPALLWPAIVVAAPLFEELLVRGFLFEGLRRGPLGAPGAVVVTAAVWAAVHLQYDAYEVGTILVFGIVLGTARLRSGSLWVPIAMHVLVNLIATVETLFVLAR
ncbi:MAG TPA: CPBP family intramembrane glutamic endopeptidase, partial [Candidatus Sulfomarinibacteraceae bacterium]|nr:CPBP family intramembrane glutamic endopeptidase [Candidatus Sulfomarinibacteraceae bacterium]